MKVTIKRDDLIEAIGAVSRAVSAKSTIPALEGILIRAEGGTVLTGYDLEMGIECAVESRTEETGSIVLPARTFGEIVRKMEGETVSIETDEYNKTTIESAYSRFEIIGIPAAEYPELPDEAGDKKFSLPQKLLKDMIRQTVFAVSQSESKPVHTGCLFTISGTLLTVVAVDGSRLALRRETLEQQAESELNFVVPGKTLNEISKILGDAQTPVSVNLGQKQIKFEFENIKLVSRLLEGEFINYENAIPKENDTYFEVDTAVFSRAVERVSLLISERLKSPIRLKAEPSSITLFSTTPTGSAKDSFAADVTGGELEIGFNNRFVAEALRYCERERIFVGLKTPLTPMVISPVEKDGSFLYLVLPVRLK